MSAPAPKHSAPKPYKDLEEVDAPGLYHCLGTDRIELWMMRGGKLYCDGWIAGSHFVGDVDRDVFIERWLADVRRRDAAGETP